MMLPGLRSDDSETLRQKSSPIGRKRKSRYCVADLTRRSFSSKAAACFAALGTFSGLNQTAHAQIVWKTAQWQLASFEELLGEKARVKQLFDITQIENGAALSKIKTSFTGPHFDFDI